jgi:hypothetical protein
MVPQASQPFFRIDDRVSAAAQLVEVAAHRGVGPHVAVHGGGQNHGPGEGEIEGAQEIVGDAVGELAEQVRGRRRDDQDIIVLRDADVFDRTGQHIVRGTRAEHRRDDFTAGERGEG